MPPTAASAGEGGPGGSPIDPADSPNDPDGTIFQSVAESVPPGPYDAAAVPVSSVSRVDPGSMQVAGFTSMNITLESDPSQTRIVSIVASFEDAALRIQPLAAPAAAASGRDAAPDHRIDQVRRRGHRGGPGRFGTELLAAVPAQLPDGQTVRQPLRLIGVEGPRWLLHGVFMGSSVEDQRKSELFEDVFTQVVVLRGDQPMAPGEVLPIKIPPESSGGGRRAAAQAAQAGQAAPPPQGPSRLRTVRRRHRRWGRCLAKPAEGCGPEGGERGPTEHLAVGRGCRRAIVATTAWGIAAAHASATSVGCRGSSARATTALRAATADSSPRSGPREVDVPRSAATRRS